MFLQSICCIKNNPEATEDERSRLIRNEESNLVSETIESKLLNSVMENNESNIINHLNNSHTEPNYFLNYRYENGDNKTVLIIAAITDSVLPNTFDVLCKQMKDIYGTLHYKDELFYGWELLHYVARTANLDKLKYLLKYIPEEKINALTNFSENALHVLLQYEKSNPPFSILIKVENEFSYGSIVAPEDDKILDFALELINKEINVNHRNFWNESPICLAMRYKYKKLITELLKMPNIDTNSCCDSGRTVREEQEVEESWTQEDPIREKFNYLKAGDEENFLKYAAGNITGVNCFDGDQVNSCGTMLHFCVRKGFVEFFQNRGFNESVTKCDIMNNPMLNTFKSKGFARSILFLLDNGADPSLKSENFPQHLLEYSSLRFYYPVVAILLQHRSSKISPELIFTILEKLTCTKLIDPKLTSSKFYLIIVLRLLLNKLILILDESKTLTIKEKSDLHKLFSNKRPVLNELLHGLDLKSKDLNVQQIIRQVLYLGASLTSTTSNLTTTKTNIILENCRESNSTNGEFDMTLRNCTSVISSDSKLTLRESNSTFIEPYQKPNKYSKSMVIKSIDFNILKSHFDDCIDGTTFKYDSIIHYYDNKTHNENKCLYFMMNDNKKQHLLCHPIMLELLTRKWPKIKFYFRLDMIFYGLLLFGIYSTVIGLHYNYFNYDSFCRMYYIFWFMVVIYIVKEIFQLIFIFTYFSDPLCCLEENVTVYNAIKSTIKCYVCQSSNIFDISTIVLSLITLITPNIYSSVLTVLSGTFIFFIMLGQIPRFTKYFIIFPYIKSTVEYTLFYSILFVSFAISFFLVCPVIINDAENSDIKNTSTNNNIMSNSTDSNPPDLYNIFKGLLLNIFFTFIYFSGEFEDAATKPTDYPVFGRVIMTVFVFCITIILNNLLVSLIISDMDIYEERAKLYKQIYSVSFIEALSGAGNIFQKYCRSCNWCWWQDLTVNIFDEEGEKVCENVNVHELDNRSQEYLENIKEDQRLNKNILPNLYASLSSG